MRVVSDRRQDGRSPEEFDVDDLPIQEMLDAELLGRRYLIETAGEPSRFLPPPRVRPRRQALPPREPESRLSKVAKLAGLTTAGTLLVGAVFASSMMTRARTEQAGRTTPPAAPVITGAAALDGFALQGAARPDQGPNHSTSPAPSVTFAKRPTTQSQSSQAAPPASASTPTSGSGSSKSTATSSAPTAEKLATVNEFYQRMGSRQPQDALAMLAPGLAGDRPGELVYAWSSMRQVDVKNVRVRPDGSVLAVVDMVKQDGTRLRVTQVLQVANDVIEQAMLVCAEQL